MIRNGELLRRNMRREFLTEEERMHIWVTRVSTYKDLKAAYIEGEGQITIISRKQDGK